MTESKKGNIYIIVEMILWSFFPIVSFLGLGKLPGIVALFWVNIFSTLLFLIIMIFRKKLKELKNKKAWIYAIGTVIFINIIFYGLFFYALDKTTPSNVAIMGLFEIVPSYIFFQLVKKEHFSKIHLLGIILAITGVLIVLLPKAGKVNIGDYIIIFSAFFPPFGNWCQQQTRKLVSSETALFLRHLMATPFLFILAVAFKSNVANYDISEVIIWLLINGIFVFGLSKIFWLEAIHRMSVTKALAINSLAPVFTVLFAWILLNQAPTYIQLLALPFLIVSILILTNFKFKR